MTRNEDEHVLLSVSSLLRPAACFPALGQLLSSTGTQSHTADHQEKGLLRGATVAWKGFILLLALSENFNFQKEEP